MSEGPIPCKQDGCDADATHRYTWAGRDESFACVRHAIQLQTIAYHVDYHLQMIPLTLGDYMRASRMSEPPHV